MASRHRSRYRAVQLLYQVDMRHIEPEIALRAYYDSLYSEEHEEKPDRDPFMESLIHGTLARTEEIDTLMTKHSAHWKIERMPAVDRNIIRLAIYEMLGGKTPPPVIIDEALDLTRRFSGDESVSFVNGVLDAVRKELSR